MSLTPHLTTLALLGGMLTLGACGGGGSSSTSASSNSGGGNSGGGTTGTTATAPAITQNPVSVAVTAGSIATFTVTATGSSLTYQWSENGAAIAGATAASYSTPATTTSDSGASFTVTVTNALGSKTSSAAVLTVTAAATASTTDVVTYHNDNQRTGQNLAETVLTVANVKQSAFGVLHLLAVDGKVDAQPLALSAYSIGGTVHNVVYVATEHDSVYAFDSDSATPLWKVSLLGSAETPSDNRGCTQVTPEIGITATPVIDRAAGSLLVVAMSKDSGGNYHQRLHALNLSTGAELAHSPVDITASVAGTGAPATVSGRIVFDPGQYEERSALLLSQGTIYTSWSSHCDVENYTGWIIAYAESSLQQSAVFNDEPSGSQNGQQGEASFWNSNSGPSADATGNIYAMSANGVFDVTLTADGFPTGNDYGNSIIKLSTPANGALTVLDYFTMFNTVAESDSDTDLASGGLMLLPDQVDASGATRHLAVGAGKDRNIYLVDRDSLGKFNTGSDDNAYQPLLDAFPPSAASCGTGGASGVYGAPVYFNGTVYYSASGDGIRGFKLAAAKMPSQPTLKSSMTYCYPGAPMSVSASGTQNAIVWAVQNSSSQGVLHAYDAATLAELYNSTQAGTRDQFGPGSKFTPPAIANGKVFVGTQADTSAGGKNYVAIFGPL
ncbi:MAG: pyrrolo-quinoline quinone [Steroidobacteraceae bacterium]